METQQFCLKWNSHQANMLTVFEQLLSTEALVDVTLACDGLSLKAHKVVLSACSPYFQSLFVDNPCKHPIVIMKDMRYSDLKAIIDFMYKGEVNVSHDQLNALLKTAETLKVKGLAEMSGENRAASSGTVQQNASSPPPTNMPVAQTRSDSPAMLSKRKHGRPRKRYRSGSVHSDEEIVPTKIKEPESPEIEELPQDPSDSISESIPVSSKHQTPIHSSAAVNNSHLSRKSQSSRSSHQTEEPPSDSDFSIEPSKLMEQTLTTTPVISNGLAQSSSSGISVNTSSSLSIVPTSLSIVPAESQLSIATDSHSSNQTQGPDSPQDVKPLLSFEEPLISVDPSQDNSSFMDSSGVPAIAGTSSSYQEDQQALVPQDTQSQDLVCIETKIEGLQHFEECYEYFAFATHPDTYMSIPSAVENSVALTEKKCQCGICKQSFWPEEIEEHECIKSCFVSVARMKHTHQCDVCNEKFLSKDLFKGHTCTPIDSKKPIVAPSWARYHCSTCRAGFHLKQQLKDHLRTHQKPKPFQCEICLKWYTTKQTLKHHLMLHKNKKPLHLQCTWCQKKFSSKNAFETHIRTHTKGKRYECERCGKHFLRALDLSIHRIVHTHKKPFRCKVCDREFIDRKYLNRHMQVHTDDLPHRCKICFKGFSSKSYLERHLNTHTKKRPFKCKHCPKSFKDNYHLRQHLVAHKSVKNYHCAVCGKSFAQKDSLYYHKFTHQKHP